MSQLKLTVEFPYFHTVVFPVKAIYLDQKASLPLKTVLCQLESEVDKLVSSNLSSMLCFSGEKRRSLL